MTDRQIDKRAGIWAQMQEIRDNVEKDGWTAELREAWDKADADLDVVDGDIERDSTDKNLRERFEKIETDTVVVDPGTQRDGGEQSKESYRAAFDKFIRGGAAKLNADERDMLEANFRAQGEATGSAGGYTVPEAFWAKITESMKWYGGAEEGADILNSTDGQPIVWPSNDDTANVGVIVDENTQHTEQDLTFGQKTLGAYTFSSKVVRVSFQLLQDSGVDIESYLARKLGERIGRAQNTYFTTGTGTGQPQGYITGSSAGVTASSTSVITYNEIVDLVHSVDPAYRQGGRCRFKFNDSALKSLRKVRDDSGGAGLGRPIWEPSVQVGVPNSLFGYPYTINNDQASIATGNKTVAFGDFQAGFVVRHVSGGQLLRLTERWADFLQVGFLAFDRADSIVQDTAAIKHLVQA